MPTSYSHGVATEPLIGMTIGDMLDLVAARHGANEAVVSVFENKRLTYAALLDEVNRCARSLLAIGIQKGDRVGVWSTNCVDWIVVQFATAKIGAARFGGSSATAMITLDMNCSGRRGDRRSASAPNGYAGLRA